MQPHQINQQCRSYNLHNSSTISLHSHVQPWHENSSVQIWPKRLLFWLFCGRTHDPQQAWAMVSDACFAVIRDHSYQLVRWPHAFSNYPSDNLSNLTLNCLIASVWGYRPIELDVKMRTVDATEFLFTRLSACWLPPHVTSKAHITACATFIALLLDLYCFVFQ